MKQPFAQALMEIAGDCPNLMLLSADLGFGLFDEFQDLFPRQFVNVGIAEQNMISVASGLAKEGHVVIAYSIANFPILRCFEQIRNDAVNHDVDVKIVSMGGGFSYGALGMSHHATEDLAIMRALPGVGIFTPGTASDVKRCLRALIHSPGTGYLRLDRSVGQDPVEDNCSSTEMWRLMEQGEDVALITCGGILEEAQAAAVILKTSGLSCRIINATQLAPLSSSKVRESVQGVKLVVTVEEHVPRGGLGGLVAEIMAETKEGPPVIRKGMSGGYPAFVGDQRFLRARLGLDALGIVTTVREFCCGISEASSDLKFRHFRT